MPGRRHAPTGDPALKTPARLKLRAAILLEVKQGRGCEMPTCLMPTRDIDWTAPARTPWAYVLDEIIIRDHGGRADDPANVRPAHHRCNSAAGARITNAKKRTRNPTYRPATASRW